MVSLDKQFLDALIGCASLANLTGGQKRYWVGNPAALADVLGRVLRTEGGIVADDALTNEPPPRLLTFVGEVPVGMPRDSFFARNMLMVNTGPSAQVRISYIGSDFERWFLSGKGVIEGLDGVRMLGYQDLQNPRLDSQLVREVGGEGRALVMLREVFSLMERQGHGEEGVLLNDGRANIFYVLDQNQIIRAVNVRWWRGGWSMGARSCESQTPWRAGCRVFFHHE